jgi:hypothetical protein
MYIHEHTIMSETLYACTYCPTVHYASLEIHTGQWDFTASIFSYSIPFTFHLHRGQLVFNTTETIYCTQTLVVIIAAVSSILLLFDRYSIHYLIRSALYCIAIHCQSIFPSISILCVNLTYSFNPILFSS